MIVAGYVLFQENHRSRAKNVETTKCIKKNRTLEAPLCLECTCGGRGGEVGPLSGSLACPG
jgi:hypothetical protein